MSEGKEFSAEVHGWNGSLQSPRQETGQRFEVSVQVEGAPQVPRAKRAYYGISVYSAEGGQAVQHARHAELPANHPADDSDERNDFVGHAE